MAYDERIAARVREIVEPLNGMTERKMFGGIAFMAHGHMFLGVLGDDLMARVGPNAYVNALQQPHVREMDFTGRSMKGYIYVEPPGFESDTDLEHWVNTCLEFVESLPPKT